MQVSSSLESSVMQRKKWIIAIIVIVSAIAAYLAFVFLCRSYYNRGTVYYEKGEYDEAILCFDKAISLKPRFAEAYCSRGTAYYQKGEYDQAILDFNKAIERNPKLAEAYYNRAVVYYHKQEYDKAWEDVQKARNLEHQIPPTFLKDLHEASEEGR